MLKNIIKKTPKVLLIIGIGELLRSVFFISYYVILYNRQEINLSFGIVFNFFIWIISIIGIICMKKWGFLIFITVQIYFFLIYISAGSFPIIEFILPILLIYICIKNYAKMT